MKTVRLTEIPWVPVKFSRKRTVSESYNVHPCPMKHQSHHLSSLFPKPELLSPSLSGHRNHRKSWKSQFHVFSFIRFLQLDHVSSKGLISTRRIFMSIGEPRDICNPWLTDVFFLSFSWRRLTRSFLLLKEKKHKANGHDDATWNKPCLGHVSSHVFTSLQMSKRMQHRPKINWPNARMRLPWKFRKVCGTSLAYEKMMKIEESWSQWSRKLQRAWT